MDRVNTIVTVRSAAFRASLCCKGSFMPDVLVDYVVRQSGGQWAVVRRTFDASTIWLNHAPVSTHGAEDEAVAAMQRLNRPAPSSRARRRRAAADDASV